MNAAATTSERAMPVADPTPERPVAPSKLAGLTGSPLLTTLLAALLGALGLQLWRPCFFLTCDTLTATLPVQTEAYRRLWEGQSPLYNPYLFGGYDLLTDLGHFILWGPLALPFSFLAKTAYYFLLPDIVSTLSLVVMAGAFCWSALRLRRTLNLPISNGWIVALSLSYTFTPYNLIVGASWLGFLNIGTCYPLLLAGAFERDWRKSGAIQTIALFYAVFGGHMHPFTMFLLFGGLTVVLAAYVQRSVRPVIVWVGAGVLTLLLILPLLWPALVGFGQSARSHGLSVGIASGDNVPFPALGASFLLGPLSQGVLDGIHIDLSDPAYNTAIAFSLVNLPLVGLLVWKRRWNALEAGLAALAVAAVFCIARPAWLGQVFSHLPLLRSLRWPFREIAVLQFFAHALFLVGYRPPATQPARRTVAYASLAGALAFPLIFLCAAPTFWLFEPDRQLVMSGEADRYWNELKAQNGITAGGPRFAVQAEPKVLWPQRPAVPFVLLGAFNYASLFRVPNVMGYSTVPPANALWLERELRIKPWFWGGVFSGGATARIVAAHPDVQRITLTGMAPTTWRVFDGTPQAEEFRVDWPAGRVVRLDAPPALSSAFRSTSPALQP